MHQGSDLTGAPPSLGARRPAASNLPSLNELPPPPLTQLHSKFQPYGTYSALSQPQATSGSVASVGNLLTPPNTLPSESGLGSNPVTASTSPLPSFQPHQPQPGMWSGAMQQSNQQYAPYSSATTPNWIPPRGMFSPSSLDSLVRSNATANAGMQPPVYELNQLPPFAGNPNYSGSVTLPAMGQSQQMQNAGGSYMNVGNQAYASQQSPMGHQEHYGARPPPTPTYFSQAQQSPSHSQPSFPFSTSVNTSQAGPLSPANTSDAAMSTGNPLDRTTSHHSTTSQSPPIYQRSSFGQYSNQGLNGPVLSTLHSPNNHMLVNNMSAGVMGAFNNNHANMQSLYGAGPTDRQHQPQPQHQTPTDRPFKCDSCPQSFNRNHDLKRHKRIHLAVKPYPCGHCEKSFSRKDALKRHILVKGCGKSDDSLADAKSGSASPQVPFSKSSSLESQG